ncbi:MAG: hypothetical protein M3Z64_03190 [Verrucomicrobiota bacterium]|nr:hypothetical protein [Verrucomicrobiota bacterium]
MKKLYLLAATSLLAFAGGLQAQNDYVVLDRTADDYDRVVTEPDGSTRVYDGLSRDLNVPVNVLEQERATTRLGYGGLFIANSIAAETGRPFDEIVALKQSGRGWGEIGRQYNVNVGSIASRTHRADSYFRGNGNVKRDEMKAEKFVNGHDARDGKWNGTGKGAGHGNTKVKHQRKIKGEGNGNGHGKGKDKGHGGGHGKH